MRGRRVVRFALDTGAGQTIVRPDVLDDLGYSPRQGEAMTSIRSVVGVEHGYYIRVDRLHCLGHDLADFRVAAHDLPDGFGIDGLLGPSYLRNFNYEIRSSEGRLLVTRA